MDHYEFLYSLILWRRCAACSVRIFNVLERKYAECGHYQQMWRSILFNQLCYDEEMKFK